MPGLRTGGEVGSGTFKEGFVPHDAAQKARDKKEAERARLKEEYEKAKAKRAEVADPSKIPAGDALDRSAKESARRFERRKDMVIGRVEATDSRRWNFRVEVDGQSVEIKFDDLRRIVERTVKNIQENSLTLPISISTRDALLYRLAEETMDGRQIPEGDVDRKKQQQEISMKVLFKFREMAERGEQEPIKTEEEKGVQLVDDTPSPQGKKRLRRRVGVIDVSDAIEQEARERAEAALTEKQPETPAKGLAKIAGWVGRTASRLWKGNLMREYYRQKEIAHAKSDIRETGNLYAGAADMAAHDAAMDSIVSRFVTAYDENIADDLIHTEAGERVDQFRESEAHAEIQRDLNELVKGFARGRIDEAQFRTMRRDTFARVREAHMADVRAGSADEVFGEGEMYADNLLEIAREVRAMVEHGESVENLDIDFDLTVGRAKAGVRTEMQFNAVDRLTQKMTDSKFGAWLSGVAGAAATETAVAGALSVGYSLTAALSERAARSKLFAFGSFGATALFAGGIAAFRERRQLERERRLHTRERAKSASFVADRDTRREQMEGFIYETRNAGDLAGEAEALLDKETLEPQESARLLELVADMDARIQVSDREGIDLLSYSSPEALEQERLRLDIVRARARVEMRRSAEQAGTAPADFDAEYQKVLDARRLELHGGPNSEASQKDKLYEAMRLKRTAAKFVTGVLTGVAIGLTVQELVATFSDKSYGIIDALRGKKPLVGEHFTGMEYLHRWVKGDLPTVPGTAHLETIANGQFKVPDGMSLQQQPDGTYALMAGKQHVLDGLEVDPDGTLSSKSIALLGKNGIGVSESTATASQIRFKNGPQHTEAWVKQNADQMREVSRDLWYGQNSPMFKDPLTGKMLGADHNELRLHWGGASGTGVDAQGNFVFDVSEMAKDGSWQGVHSADAQQLMVDGKLKVLLSFNSGTQDHVFEIPIGLDGQAVIHQNSPMGKMLFEQAGGKARFLGRFAEVAQMMGADDKGVEHVRLLATHVSDGLDTVLTEVPVVYDVDTVLTSLDVPHQVDIMPPPVLPLLWRRPLERATREQRVVVKPQGPDVKPLPPPPDQDRLPAPPKREAFPLSPEIKQLHDTAESIVESRNEAVDTYLDQLPEQEAKSIVELNRQIGEPMNELCRMSIVLPVMQEGGDITALLESYTTKQQDAEGKAIDPSTMEMIVLLSPDVHRGMPSATEKAVNDFKLKHPEFKVHLVKQLFEDADAGTGVTMKQAADLALARNRTRTDAVAKARHAVHVPSWGVPVDNQFVVDAVGAFKERANTEHWVPTREFDERAMERWPLLRFLTSIEKTLEKQFTGSVDSDVGVFSAGLYAKAGGFRGATHPDMTLLTRMKDILRTAPEQEEHKSERVILQESPQKALYALMNGLPFRTREKLKGDNLTAAEAFDWEPELKEKSKELWLSKENVGRELTAYLHSFLARTMRDEARINALAGKNASRPEMRLAAVAHVRGLLKEALYSLVGPTFKEGENYTITGGERDFRSVKVDVLDITTLRTAMMAAP